MTKTLKTFCLAVEGNPLGSKESSSAQDQPCNTDADCKALSCICYFHKCLCEKTLNFKPKHIISDDTQLQELKGKDMKN